jgi:hypothetical protein
MSNQKCKKLGNHATKRERAETRQAELEMRAIRRSHDLTHIQSRSKEHIFANLSVSHEHYGDTPSENFERKFDK